MFFAKRTYQEWAALVPWQREDIIRRFAKYQEEQQKEMEEQQNRLKAPVKGSSGKGTPNASILRAYNRNSTKAPKHRTS